VLAIQLLRIVGAVERIALAVVARAGVIASDDEVGAPVVLPDDRVPQRLPRARHAHGEVEQAQGGRLVGVLVQDVLVAANTGEVIDVAGLGHADHRVNQQIRLHFACSPERQLLVGAVQRVAGLEGDHLAPALLPEPASQLGRRVSQQLEIVVGLRLDAVHATTDVDGARVVHQVTNTVVQLVLGAVDRSCFMPLVRTKDTADIHRRQKHAFGISQRDAPACRHRPRERLADIEHDGYRPERAVRQTHVVADRVVGLLVQEAVQGRVRTVGQQIEIAQLARGQVPGRIVSGQPLFRFGFRLRQVQLLQLTAVRFLEGSHDVRSPARVGVGCPAYAMACAPEMDRSSLVRFK